MQLWQQTEDYRRGCELSENPFPFYGGEPNTCSDTQRWAESIFNCFLRPGSSGSVLAEESDVSRCDIEATLLELDKTKIGYQVSIRSHAILS